MGPGLRRDDEELFAPLGNLIPIYSQALRMRFVISKPFPHPEEARRAVSKGVDTGKPHFSAPC